MVHPKLSRKQLGLMSEEYTTVYMVSLRVKLTSKNHVQVKNSDQILIHIAFSLEISQGGSFGVNHPAPIN